MQQLLLKKHTLFIPGSMQPTLMTFMRQLLLKHTLFIQWSIQPTLMTCFYKNYTSDIQIGHTLLLVTHFCWSHNQPTQYTSCAQFHCTNVYNVFFFYLQVITFFHIISMQRTPSYVHLTVYKCMYITYNRAYKCLFRIPLHLDGSGIYSIRDFSYLDESTASFLWLEGR